MSPMRETPGPRPFSFERHRARFRIFASWLALILLPLLFLMMPERAFSQATRDDVWDQVGQGRAVVLLRHALAPGFGDPPGFRIGDCSTQRNLSEEGRDQARAIGEFLRRRGVTSAAVYTSQWCRCIDTARLLNVGRVLELPSLNSFFEDSAPGEGQTRDLRRFIASLPAKGPAVFVTHQVNITALTGIVPSPGEIVVFRLTGGEKGVVLGRFMP